MREKYFQDFIPDNNCFGCGTENDKGLQIKSYWSGDNESTCTFQPQPHHAAGPLQFMNGGISATIIDCHCVCTATAAHYKHEGRDIGSGELIWCVTGSLELQYKKPVPINQSVRLVAKIEKFEGKKAFLSCHLFSGNELCVTASLLAIRVPNEWLKPSTN